MITFVGSHLVKFYSETASDCVINHHRLYAMRGVMNSSLQKRCDLFTKQVSIEYYYRFTKQVG